MKISVLIPSRGRPFKLWLAVGGLRELESGKHDVTYVIGADEDDPDTINTCEVMKMDGRTAYGIFRRPPSLGGMDNALARHAPADAYVVLGDDLQVVTRGWDDVIAKAWEAKPDGVWWWSSRTEPSPLAPIVSHKWLEAAGRIFTDYFPFWWDDLWLLEVWILAAEKPPQFIDAYLLDRPTHTHRMRDLRFWSDFYHHPKLKAERRESAKRIAKALGWNLTGITDELSTKLFDPAADFLNRIEDIERQGDTGKPPTPEYLKARERAQFIMDGAVYETVAA